MYSLNQFIGSESIVREYKEFYLRKAITLHDYKDLQEGFISNKVRKYILDSLIFYFLSKEEEKTYHLPNLHKDFYKIHF